MRKPGRKGRGANTEVIYSLHRAGTRPGAWGPGGTNQVEGRGNDETIDTVVGAAERDLTLRAMDPILTVGAVKAGSDAMIRPHRNN